MCKSRQPTALNLKDSNHLGFQITSYCIIWSYLIPSLHLDILIWKHWIANKAITLEKDLKEKPNEQILAFEKIIWNIIFPSEQNGWECKHSKRYEVLSNCGFNFHFSKWLVILRFIFFFFCIIRPFVFPILRKVYLGALPIFKSGLFIFLLWVVWVPYIVWILTPCWIYS